MTNTITVKLNDMGGLTSQLPVTIKNTPTLVSGTLKLEGLTNIDTTQEENGSTLLYDSITGNWVASPLNVDGGNF
jgi:hypothetical protein